MRTINASPHNRGEAQKSPDPEIGAFLRSNLTVD